jgi:branched-chain amino acid transport system substrate-binding protein
MHRLFGVSLLLYATGCGGGSGPAPIHVGHVATLSGPNNEGGEQAVRGIRLAVEEQNEAARQNNTRPVIVHHPDTQGNLNAFESQAVRLVTINHAVALLGGTSAAEVVRLDKAQVPIVTSGQRTRGLSERVFFTGLSSAFQGQVLAQFALQDLHASKLAVLVDERREESLALSEAFTRALGKAAAKKDAGTVARIVTLRYGQDAPISDWAKRLAEEKPQALLVAGAARDLTRLRDGLHFAGPILFGADEGSSRAFVEAREAGRVFLVTAFVPDLDVPRAREFISRYRKAFSEDPDVHAALAYDSARLLFEAIGNSQLPGLEGLNKELPQELSKLKDFPGLTGPLGFNADRQLLRPAFIVQVQNDGLKTVKRFPPEN